MKFNETPQIEGNEKCSKRWKKKEWEVKILKKTGTIKRTNKDHRMKEKEKNKYIQKRKMQEIKADTSGFIT
jgi:hypothetical protein